jgi:hypothetical protein
MRHRELWWLRWLQQYRTDNHDAGQSRRQHPSPGPSRRSFLRHCFNGFSNQVSRDLDLFLGFLLASQSTDEADTEITLSKMCFEASFAFRCQAQLKIARNLFC